MKAKLLTTVLLTSASLAFAQGVDIDPALARSMKSMPVNEFQTRAAMLEGQVIKIKFNYRDREIVKNDDGTLSCRVKTFLDSSRRRSADMAFGAVPVTFPAEALPWFSRISTDIESRAILVAIGRVKSVRGMPEVELIGREIKTDSRGSKVVW